MTKKAVLIGELKKKPQNLAQPSFPLHYESVVAREEE